MKHAVEIAHLVNGEPISVRRLSAAHERLAAATAVAVVILVHAGGLAATAALAHAAHRMLFAPLYLALWIISAAVVSVLVARRARRRTGRYTVGARLEADAFATIDFDLVRRTGDRLEL